MLDLIERGQDKVRSDMCRAAGAGAIKSSFIDKRTPIVPQVKGAHIHNQFISAKLKSSANWGIITANLRISNYNLVKEQVRWWNLFTRFWGKCAQLLLFKYLARM